MAIELDGAIHDQQAEYDRERDAVLTARGLQVVRIKNAEVRQDLDGVIERIARLALRRIG